MTIATTPPAGPPSAETPAVTEAIGQLLPHAGAMVLIESIVEHSDSGITCSADNHRNPEHPLRYRGSLDSAVLIEYAAQATAIHGALSTRPARPRIAFLAAVRKLKLERLCLDSLHGPLTIRARKLLESGDGVIYETTVTHAGMTLLDGRLTVMYPAEAAAPAPGSLSDLSDRREPSGEARPDSLVLEAHSGSMQRENGRIWTASPTGAADQPQVQQTASEPGA